MRLVMIDNYDSFTYNLVQLFYEFDLEVLVFRHDEIDLAGIEALVPDWLCISPGPKAPEQAGISKMARSRQIVIKSMGGASNGPAGGSNAVRYCTPSR